MEAMEPALIQPSTEWFLYTAAASGASQPKKTASPPHASLDEDAQVRRKEQCEVVLAEDNTGDVLLVQEVLQMHDIRARLTVHRDGEQMFRFIDRIDKGEAPCPDLVLLDLNLPRRNGEMVLARMRQSPVCGHVPVIVVTSSDSPADREIMARLGATRYFRKPSDFDEFMKLGSTIKDVLRLDSPPN